MVQAVVKYIRGSIDELKKVSWPTRQETTQFTITVLVAIVVSVALLAALDYGLSGLVNLFLIK